MTITAQQLHTWIGAEVLDRGGEKLGKLEEVYSRDRDPLVITLSSGLAGRKHHAASLRGATVSRNSLHLDATAESLVAIDGHGVDDEALTALATHDDRLGSLQPEDIEGSSARQDRLAAEAQARAAAQELDDEARLRAEEEAAAQARARDAGDEAEEARRAREEAEDRAALARRDAGGVG